MEAFRLATPLEKKAAGMAMGIISDTGVFVFNSESDQNKLIEWTIYHIRRQGKSLVEILLEQMPANTDATKLAILTAMANSSWGIYVSCWPNASSKAINFASFV